MKTIGSLLVFGTMQKIKIMKSIAPHHRRPITHLTVNGKPSHQTRISLSHPLACTSSASYCQNHISHEVCQRVDIFEYHWVQHDIIPLLSSVGMLFIWFPHFICRGLRRCQAGRHPDGSIRHRLRVDGIHEEDQAPIRLSSPGAGSKLPAAQPDRSCLFEGAPYDGAEARRAD